MIELRNLAYFLAACQNESLARAAEQLGIALSTLSVSLKSLEDDLGLTLFRRLNTGLYPTTAARWLARTATPLLSAEAFSRRWAGAPKQPPAHVLTVEIGLTFTVGRISKAISRATEALARERPNVFVDPIWTGDRGSQPVHGIADQWADAERSRIAIHVTARRDADEITLLTDRWVLASRLPAATKRPVGAAELLAGGIIVPALPQPMKRQAQDYFGRLGIRGVRFVSDHPGRLPRLLSDHPDAAFFVPSSVLSARLGLLRVTTIEPDPPLTAVIAARPEKSSAVAVLFAKHLRKALAEPESVTVSKPAISFRQVRYFNMIYRLRRVSAAAHGANIAQPALSEQLQRLEKALDARLFARSNDGVVPTPAGDRFAPVAKMIERCLREITAGGSAAFVPSGKRLTLGILPSVSQHGLLVNKITEAILDVQSRHPNLQLVVREAPNGTLQDWVVRGRVGLAIVETSLPQMARLPLGSSETLAVIANPDHKLLPPGPVKLADLAALPLALPTNRSGLRALLDAAAQDRGLEIRPCVEIDALAMMPAMLARRRLCTVLPSSAVLPELAAGELVAHPIVEPAISRRLFVIYSGDRSLTESERDLVQILRGHLAENKTTGNKTARAAFLREAVHLRR